eukprot:771091-Prymnesium_polylepis.1
MSRGCVRSRHRVTKPPPTVRWSNGSSEMPRSARMHPSECLRFVSAPEGSGTWKARDHTKPAEPNPELAGGEEARRPINKLLRCASFRRPHA